ncbi:MAG: NAD(P)H-dependent oxidoreductase [Calditrichaeota bacterium]|nr:NAD(P)H-dependent oxidoreductase [Calditrichota bacterium]
MKKLLILFAHPAYQKSRINKKLIHGVSEIENVTFHDLYERYPELDIDVKYEQNLLLEHDVIIFQHPFFWYSTPAILKEWQDLVLEHGWAYGRNGLALKGKVFFNAITTGGKKEAYSSDGFHGCTVRQLLLPIEKTAKLCRMQYLPPFVVHGTHAIDPQQTQIYNSLYIEILEKIRDDKMDLQAAQELQYLNDYPLKKENDNE